MTEMDPNYNVTELRRKLAAAQEKIRGHEEWLKADSQYAENLRLRKLLWVAWSKGMGYGDDGEMQFAGMDFKRDPLELLERKMYERNLPAVKAFLEARDREESKCQSQS